MSLIQKVIRCRKCGQITTGIDATSAEEKYGCKCPPELYVVTGIELIAAERRRQIEKEGWTQEHDDEHIHGALSSAGASYAINASENIDRSVIGVVDTIEQPNDWPFLPKYWKPTPNDLVKQLTKAGALIVAEIDRLQRDA